MTTFSDERDAAWQRICRGEACRLCECPLPLPRNAGLRYCSTCAPTSHRRPYPVRVHIDHHLEGWSAHIAAEGADLVYWMVCLTDQQLHGLLQRLRLAPSEREKLPRCLRGWGRTSVHAHLDRRQARIFTWAARRDRRNGYEKLNSLQAGGSKRR